MKLVVLGFRLASLRLLCDIYETGLMECSAARTVLSSRESAEAFSTCTESALRMNQEL